MERDIRYTYTHLLSYQILVAFHAHSFQVFVNLRSKTVWTGFEMERGVKPNDGETWEKRQSG